jgi:hypothetical protein
VTWIPDDSSAPLNQTCGFNVVDGGSAEILEGSQQGDGVTGIVKLAVVIENAAAKIRLPSLRAAFPACLLRESNSEWPNDNFPESCS